MEVVCMSLGTAVHTSVTLNLNEKGDGRSYFYFLMGAREKEGRSLYHVILKKKKIKFH